MYNWRRVLLCGSLSLFISLAFAPANAQSKRLAPKPKSMTAVINVPKTLILKEPIGGAAVIDTASKGKKVRVLSETDDGYTQIVFKDSFGIVQRGWVESQRLSRQRRAPPKAGQATPLEENFEGVDEDAPKQTYRADEWALSTPSLYFLNEWTLGYLPRRWRPMVSLQTRYLGTSYQVKIDDINQGLYRRAQIQGFLHAGFGVWRRFGIYITQPYEQITESSELSGPEEVLRRSGTGELQYRATGLLSERNSRTNIQLGALYSPAGKIQYDTLGDIKNASRGRTLMGLHATYWDLTADGGWMLIFDLRQFGEAVGIPSRGNTESSYLDVAGGASYRFSEQNFISDVGYLLTVTDGRSIASTSGATSKVKISPVHRLFADVRYVFSGEMTVNVYGAATAGGIIVNSNSTELNPNVGVHVGLGFNYSF